LVTPISGGKVDLSVVKENSDRIRQLLYHLCPAVVANSEALSSNVKFFAASSFGHTPVKFGEGKWGPDPGQIKPVFVEVPPLWILSQICPDLFHGSHPERSQVTT
jgi:hypothetical protein